jgi:hypothetical protein
MCCTIFHHWSFSVQFFQLSTSAWQWPNGPKATRRAIRCIKVTHSEWISKTAVTHYTHTHTSIYPNKKFWP